MIMEWNSRVNQKLSLDGEWGVEDNSVTLQFESGKTRKHLKNSFASTIYESLSLSLNNKVITNSGKTEFEEFRYWHEIVLRYGVLYFYFPRIGYKNEIGIYEFTSNPKYDAVDGIVIASFGLKEIGVV